MRVKIKLLRPDAIVPQYQTEQAAAADLCAAIDAPIILKPLERAVVPTGISIELEAGYEMQIRARSGTALRQGLALVNGIGTIDADYRGEVGILLINLGSEDIEITPGMRIAQTIIAPCPQVAWEVVEELSDTLRGSGGFGSTGQL